MTIKEMRTACGMTQAQFSEYFGIPKRTIENWEGGKNTAPDYVIKLIEFRLKTEKKI